jgi:exodeoxyribonuclease V beta subunit
VDEPRSEEVLLSSLVPLWREQVPSGLLSGYPDALADWTRRRCAATSPAVSTPSCASAGGTVVVDYKTNRLGVRGTPLTTWDYRPEALEAAMVEAHYPLQALLYDVALHRYLRWRQPELRPGGAPGRRALPLPARDDRADGASGVFAWRPPAALVTATSDLLAGVR